MTFPAVVRHVDTLPVQPGATLRNARSGWWIQSSLLGFDFDDGWQMRYEIGDDGVLKQVDDDAPSPQPIKPPRTTTHTSTTTSQTSTSSTRRWTTSTVTSPSTETTSTRRRSIDLAPIFLYASRAIMVIAALLGIVLVFGNYDAGVGILDYFTRMWHNLSSTLARLDPLYGFTTFAELSEPSENPLEVFERLILGREIFGFAFSAIRILFLLASDVLGLVFDGLSTLITLVFGFLL